MQNLWRKSCKKINFSINFEAKNEFLHIFVCIWSLVSENIEIGIFLSILVKICVFQVAQPGVFEVFKMNTNCTNFINFENCIDYCKINIDFESISFCIRIPSEISDRSKKSFSKSAQKWPRKSRWQNPPRVEGGVEVLIVLHLRRAAVLWALFVTHPSCFFIFFINPWYYIPCMHWMHMSTSVCIYIRTYILALCL